MDEKMVNSSFYSCVRGNSLKGPASKAYEQVFAPHHGWALRKAVAAGMYALPTKAQLLNNLNEDGECLDHLKRLLMKFIISQVPERCASKYAWRIKTCFQFTCYLTWCTLKTCLFCRHSNVC
jgi:hypothetical protein